MLADTGKAKKAGYMRVYMRQSKQSEVVARRPRTAHDMEVLSAFAEEVNAFLRANDRECMEFLEECFKQRPWPLQRTPSRLDPRGTRFEKRSQRLRMRQVRERCHNIVCEPRNGILTTTM